VTPGAALTALYSAPIFFFSSSDSEPIASHPVPW
jgi:hypothetical protein